MQPQFDLTLSADVPLGGTCLLPGDKSLSHRAALFAALAEGESVIDRFLVSGVTHAMLNALDALGIVWHLDDSRLTVQGRGLRGFTPPAAPLDCGNSATTIRRSPVRGCRRHPLHARRFAGLRRRPMDRITAPLLRMVPITSSEVAHR